MKSDPVSTPTATQESTHHESSEYSTLRAVGVLRTDEFAGEKFPVTSFPCCASPSPSTMSSSPPTEVRKPEPWDWTHLFEDLAFKAFLVAVVLLVSYAILRAVYNTVTYFI